MEPRTLNNHFLLIENFLQCIFSYIHFLSPRASPIQPYFLPTQVWGFFILHQVHFVLPRYSWEWNGTQGFASARQANPHWATSLVLQSFSENSICVHTHTCTLYVWTADGVLWLLGTNQVAWLNSKFLSQPNHLIGLSLKIFYFLVPKLALMNLPVPSPWLLELGGVPCPAILFT